MIDTGLALDPADRTLIAQRGGAKATVGDPHGALVDWRHALQLDDSDIGPLYSSAYLLEREGRIEEATDSWRSILRWNQERGHALEAEFPTRELERLRQKIKDKKAE